MKKTIFNIFVIILLLAALINSNVLAWTTKKYSFDNVKAEVVDIFQAENITLIGNHTYYSLRIIGDYESDGYKLNDSDVIFGFDNSGNVPGNVKIGDVVLCDLQTDASLNKSDAWAINDLKIIEKIIENDDPSDDFNIYLYGAVTFVIIITIIGLILKRYYKRK